MEPFPFAVQVFAEDHVSVRLFAADAEPLTFGVVEEVCVFPVGIRDCRSEKLFFLFHVVD